MKTLIWLLAVASVVLARNQGRGHPKQESNGWQSGGDNGNNNDWQSGGDVTYGWKPEGNNNGWLVEGGNGKGPEQGGKIIELIPQTEGNGGWQVETENDDCPPSSDDNTRWQKGIVVEDYYQNVDVQKGNGAAKWQKSQGQDQGPSQQIVEGTSQGTHPGKVREHIIVILVGPQDAASQSKGAEPPSTTSPAEAKESKPWKSAGNAGGAEPVWATGGSQGTNGDQFWQQPAQGGGWAPVSGWTSPEGNSVSGPSNGKAAYAGPKGWKAVQSGNNGGKLSNGGWKKGSGSSSAGWKNGDSGARPWGGPTVGWN